MRDDAATSIAGKALACVFLDEHQRLSNDCAPDSLDCGLPATWADHRSAVAATGFVRHRMRRAIEYVFEAIEANTGCAVVAVATSLAMTGCLRLLWE